MTKKELEPSRLMYPRPTLLVGANVNDKANFMAVGGGGVANAEPPMVAVPIRHHQYTLEGIKDNSTFSVNIPSSDLVKETDYCGIVSGRTTDKVKDCGFKVFYGNLKTAPLIEQCPINLECKVVHILNLGTHSFVVGEVKGSYISEDCMIDNKPDISKIKPMIFNLESGVYSSFGETIAKAFSIGRELMT
ncbi:MAG TPA: flavin reductase family protein [Dehalococcoidia bacterium]|nr:flavin reductase family protein [Dehalococcoidia bacterium]